MRVVLDTNVLVSAFFWEGNERNVVRRCRSGELCSVSSPEMMNELERVLTNKFGVPRIQVADYLKEIILFSEIVFPAMEIHVIDQDPSDDLVLETAVIGKADAIITGDTHLLRLKKYENVVIRKANDPPLVLTKNVRDGELR